MDIGNSWSSAGATASAQPLDFADHTGDLLRHASSEYRLELGWSTIVHGDQLLLLLDEDTLGLHMPTTLAEELFSALRARQLYCPIISLPGTDEPHSVVLLEPGSREKVPLLPACVRVVADGQQVALPPSMTPLGPVRWLAPHEPARVGRPPTRVVADQLNRLTDSRAADMPATEQLNRKAAS